MVNSPDTPNDDDEGYKHANKMVLQALLEFTPHHLISFIKGLKTVWHFPR